jgi:hypothetical protein
MICVQVPDGVVERGALGCGEMWQATALKMDQARKPGVLDVGHERATSGYIRRLTVMLG